MENKALCQEVGAMKEALLREEVASYSYILTKENPADKLTKPTIETPIFYNIFIKGNFDNSKSKKKVKIVKREHSYEIRMFENEQK